jgi:threonine synthase
MAESGKTMGKICSLACTRCKLTFAADSGRSWCGCGGALWFNYALSENARRWRPADLQAEREGMWRYHPVLPMEATEAVTFGEGGARFVQAHSLGAAIGSGDLWIQDDSGNPTGSCEARGASLVVGAARKLELRRLLAANGGDAGCALAAYGAAAGIAVEVAGGADSTQQRAAELRAYGAKIAAQPRAGGEPDSFAEAYRIEGLKTAGYELAERFGWKLPATVICPGGDGAATMSLWKAFLELQELGWSAGAAPKMIAVQAAGCAPLVRAFEAKTEVSERWVDPHTVANELRVPAPRGDWLMLRILRESGGRAVAVSDEQLLDGTLLMADREGVLPSLEGGACVAAARQLLASGRLSRSERIVIYNTASGLRSLPALARRFPGIGLGEQDKLGGLILPR